MKAAFELSKQQIIGVNGNVDPANWFCEKRKHESITAITKHQQRLLWQRSCRAVGLTCNPKLFLHGIICCSITLIKIFLPEQSSAKN